MRPRKILSLCHEDFNSRITCQLACVAGGPGVCHCFLAAHSAPMQFGTHFLRLIAKLLYHMHQIHMRQASCILLGLLFQTYQMNINISLFRRVLRLFSYNYYDTPVSFQELVEHPNMKVKKTMCISWNIVDRE